MSKVHWLALGTLRGVGGVTIRKRNYSPVCPADG